MKLPAIGTMLLCLTAFAGCSKAPPQVREIAVPRQVTSQVSEPDVSQAGTNGELLELLFDYRMALHMCNGKLEAIEKAYGDKE